MPKKYGLPYMGSKDKIADQILSPIPSAAVFVDLFAGGCAMTHAALLSGRFGRVIANDITDIPQVFINALEGKYENEDRWISREDFFRLKDSDPYVRLVWSFGNNCRTYIYGDIEPLKKALHWAVYYADPQPLFEYGVDVSSAMEIPDRHERWLAVKRLCQKAGITTLQHIGTHGNTPPPNRLSVKRGANVRLEHQERGFFDGRLQTMERSVSLAKAPTRLRNERTASVNTLTAKQLPPPPITVLQGDYQDVEIPEGAVVYEDPPYKGTGKYQKEGFDHERFYEWLRTRTFPVYISEYAMPDDFCCIAEFDHRSTLCQTKNNKVTERLFVHERFADDVRNQPKQLTLF